MEPPIFYAPPSEVAKDVVNLPANEVHHALEVMRLRAGELVVVVDALGSACKGEFTITDKKHAQILVHSRLRNFGEPSVRLTLAAGLATASKFDDIIEKGTELGVSRFVPVITEKSKVKIEDPERARAKVTRLEKVALAAIKQCRRSYRPEIAVPVRLKQFLAESEPDDWKLIFHPSDSSRLLEDIAVPKDVRRVSLLVGAESGFSIDEFASAIEKDYLPVSLGKRILRTETAGPVAVALVMARLGEFR